jgi:hypothetical protein
MNVQFDLPVGALVNGWRHLGGGKFAAQDDAPNGYGLPPALLDGVVARRDDELSPLVITPFEDPMPKIAWRVVVFAERGAAWQ